MPSEVGGIGRTDPPGDAQHVVIAFGRSVDVEGCQVTLGVEARRFGANSTEAARAARGRGKSQAHRLPRERRRVLVSTSHGRSRPRRANVHRRSDHLLPLLACCASLIILVLLCAA